MRLPVLWFLGLYRSYRATRPAACRFDPTCSTYTFEAVQIHGAGRGLYLGFRRVLRCNPFGGRGYDPVPGTESVMTATAALHEAASAVVAPSADRRSRKPCIREHCHA